MSDDRTTHSDGTVFERRDSYSRAIRVGAHVAVSGTAPIGADGVVHPGDTYRETSVAIAKALATAEALGAAPRQVIRTRTLVAPDAAWEDAVRAHNEAFAGIAPANTTYVVARFIPDVLVEVELDAIVPSEADARLRGGGCAPPPRSASQVPRNVIVRSVEIFPAPS